MAKAAKSKDNKPWLKSYHEMTPHDLPPFEHASLAAMLEDACQKYASRDAFSSMSNPKLWQPISNRLASKNATALP